MKPGNPGLSKGPETKTKLEPNPQKPETGKLKPEEKTKTTVEKKEKGKGNVETKEMKKLGEKFPGLMYDIKVILKLWERLWLVDLPGVGDKIENWSKTLTGQDTQTLLKKAQEAESKIKVPALTNADKIKTRLAIISSTDSEIKGLYASLGIPMPKLEDIKEKNSKGQEITPKEIKLKHLIKQLKDAKLPWRQGKKNIMEKAYAKPPKFYKGDLFVFHTSANKFKAGFIEAMNDSVIHYRTSKNGEIQKGYTNQLFVAFHLPGNKYKGNEIPAVQYGKSQKKSGNSKEQS